MYGYPLILFHYILFHDKLLFGAFVIVGVIGQYFIICKLCVVDLTYHVSELSQFGVVFNRKNDHFVDTAGKQDQIRFKSVGKLLEKLIIEYDTGSVGPITVADDIHGNAFGEQIGIRTVKSFQDRMHGCDLRWKKCRCVLTRQHIQCVLVDSPQIQMRIVDKDVGLIVGVCMEQAVKDDGKIAKSDMRHIGKLITVAFVVHQTHDQAGAHFLK